MCNIEFIYWVFVRYLLLITQNYILYLQNKIYTVTLYFLRLLLSDEYAHELTAIMGLIIHLTLSNSNIYFIRF